jgi:hypothetical protein
MKYERDRQFYRTKIRSGDVAVFRVGAFRMPIREISEGGIRYEPSSDHAPEIGERVNGTVVLETIGDIGVSGTFTRIQDGSFVLMLDPPGIPDATITAFQRFLMQRYSGGG